MHNGFILVATLSERYVKAAIHAAHSLFDFFPDANVHLFTEERFIETFRKNIDINLFYKITYSPSLYRTKLWALNKTDFDIVCYLDADMLVQSHEIQSVFDLLGENDIIFTKIREDAGATIWWDPLVTSCPHGGFFVFKNNEVTDAFFNEWHEQYEKIFNTLVENWQWHLLNPKYTWRRVHIWDQFPLFLMLCDSNSDLFNDNIKWGFINNDDWKWNYIVTSYDVLPQFRTLYPINEAYILHYPSWMIKPERISFDFKQLLAAQPMDYERED